MKLYKKFNTNEIIKRYEYLLKNLNNYYKNLYFTPSGIINKNNDNYTLIIKQRKKKKCYKY